MCTESLSFSALFLLSESFWFYFGSFGFVAVFSLASFHYWLSNLLLVNSVFIYSRKSFSLSLILKFFFSPDFLLF